MTGSGYEGCGIADSVLLLLRLIGIRSLDIKTRKRQPKRNRLFWDKNLIVFGQIETMKKPQAEINSNKREVGVLEPPRGSCPTSSHWLELERQYKVEFAGSTLIALIVVAVIVWLVISALILLWGTSIAGSENHTFGKAQDATILGGVVSSGLSVVVSVVTIIGTVPRFVERFLIAALFTMPIFSTTLGKALASTVLEIGAVTGVYRRDSPPRTYYRARIGGLVEIENDRPTNGSNLLTANRGPLAAQRRRYVSPVTKGDSHEEG